MKVSFRENVVWKQKGLELLNYSFHQACERMYCDYAVGTPPLDEVLRAPLMKSVEPIMSCSFRLGSFED